MNNQLLVKKENELRVWMRQQGRVLVAFSGGVDSSYLAFIANQELTNNAVCVTGVSASVSEYQLEIAKRIAGEHSLNHQLIGTEELDDENYRSNSGNRCYFCKTELYSRLRALRTGDLADAVMVDGTNADDENDYRPGRIAASEKGVISPLAELKFTKSDIRELSRSHGLETWDVPASPCLSSRVPVGVPVTIERLSKIEKAEALLRRSGFKEFRVRADRATARIEIAPAEMLQADFFIKIRDLSVEIKKLGFTFVSLDLEGFRSGSLNEPGTVENKRLATLSAPVSN